MNTNVVKVTSSVSYDDAIARAKLQYGVNIKIISQRTVESSSFLGMGGRRTYEIDVWLNPPTKTVQQGPTPSDLIKAAAVVQAEKQEEVFNRILSQLSQIQDRLDEDKQVRRQPQARKEELSNELTRIKTILIKENDFSETLADDIINSVKEDLSVAEAEDGDYVEEVTLKELRSRMSFYKSTARGKPRVCVLVGPTGVGKTTTIVKLAVINLKQGERPADIRFINMDNYKIGAEKQLGSYAKIMDKPFISLYDLEEDLNKAITETKDSDLILVDTSGSSPYEITRLASLSEALSKLGSHKEVYLAVSASTKESDVHEILSMFKVLHYKAVILTKLDETKRIGPILAPLIERREPIAYVTTGQNVGPDDIEEAGIAPVWRKLNGFTKNVVDKVLRQLEDENDFR
jgi:flagellar biosynthesis protein FlhF